MRKAVRKGLKITGVILLILLMVLAYGAWYLNKTFLNFEKGYEESNTEFSTLRADGFSFPDRNGNGTLEPYEDYRLPLDVRVDNALSLMTMEEKIHLLKGAGLKSALGMEEGGIPGSVGKVVPTPRLGIPTLYLSDGPAGLRIQPTREGNDQTYYCTAFPIGTLMASTWNTELVGRVGTAMGEEALEYGIDVILGPGANIHRHPLCGRNFEYYSEDPVLTGEIGAAMVNGIESRGVGTSVKHFVANNQETNRSFNNAIVSERAMREIYLRGFEIIVKKSQPWTLMSSYNKVNGTYASESKYLLTDILRGEWGFEGLVMSDWFGGQHPAAQIRAGNDLLEPGTKLQWDALKEAYASGELGKETIDTAARRVLELIFRSRKMEGYHFSNKPALQEHARVARQAASEGMVLLKNEQALPLLPGRNIALFGVTSYEFIAGGTGSGDVNEAYTISLEQGLDAAGYTVNAMAKEAFEKHREANKKAFVKPEGLDAMTEPYDPPELLPSASLLQESAREADLAIITLGRNSGEGGDRVEQDDFLLSEMEQELIENTCKAYHEQGKKVVVVLNIGGVIETASWKEKPDAILLAWQGGQEGGHAVADILSGKVNPSGRLPMTFPMQLSDHASNANFPLDGDPIDFMSLMKDEEIKPEGEWIRNKDYTLYEEGIYVGYRHFDKQDIPVSFPFGYGLSYTEFRYDEMQVQRENEGVQVQVTLTNTGTRPGREVVQLYVSKPDSGVDRPARELKAFAKTPLMQPGERITISLQVPLEDLRYWNEAAAAWELETGVYTFSAGASSRDLRLSEEIGTQPEQVPD